MQKDDLKAFTNLLNLNQKLKNITSMYYIDSNDHIYIKSLVGFIETEILLLPECNPGPFKDIIINPLELFEFQKNMKGTKKKDYEYSILEEGIKVYHPEEEDRVILFNKLQNPDKLDSEQMVNVYIKPEFYTKYYDILMASPKVNEKSWYELSTDAVEELCNSKLITINLGGVEINLTKQLFEDIKKTDSLSLTRLHSTYDEKKEYIFVKHITDMYTSFTIFAQVKI